MGRRTLHTCAAGIIDQALRKEASVKSLCFQSHFPSKKMLFALVHETLKHRKILEKLLKKSSPWENATIKPSASLQLVLTYELLLGKPLSGVSQHHNALLSNKHTLQSAWVDVKKEHAHLIPCVKSQRDILPRYVRVNTLKTTTDEVIEAFQKCGYKFRPDKNVEFYQDMAADDFFKDTNIPDLLVFSAHCDFHLNPMYLNGEIILQDKASCFPSFILNPAPGSFVIDACAAPGNKSSHLCCLTSNNSPIHAFDIDKQRLEVMRRLLKLSNATSVVTKHQDFLKIKVNDPLYSRVEYILLDPSCSGSGIISRMDDVLGEEREADKKARLGRLSRFQTAALCHALSFPSVKRVVYSTCSIHQQENENVVETVYNRFSGSFALLHAFPEWLNRGVGEWDQAAKCVRADPVKNYTNGFFVALFERVRAKKDLTNTDAKDVTSEHNRKRKLTVEPKQEIDFNADITHSAKERLSDKCAKTEANTKNGVSEKKPLQNAVCARGITISKKKRRNRNHVKRPII